MYQSEQSFGHLSNFFMCYVIEKANDYTDLIRKMVGFLSLYNAEFSRVFARLIENSGNAIVKQEPCKLSATFVCYAQYAQFYKILIWKKN